MGSDVEDRPSEEATTASAHVKLRPIGQNKLALEEAVRGLDGIEGLAEAIVTDDVETDIGSPSHRPHFVIGKDMAAVTADSAGGPGFIDRTRNRQDLWMRFFG